MTRISPSSPPMSASEQARMLDRFDSIAANSAAEQPSRCGWCGGPWIHPVFVTNRRTWLCLDCQKEFSTGVTG